jgi:hypothetical protein
MGACVPPPPPRIARRSPKMRKKNTGWGPRTRPHSQHASLPRAPQRLISKKGQKYLGGPVEFFLTHVCESTHSLVYIIGLIIKNGVIFFFFFSLTNIYCGYVMCNDEASNVVICSLNVNIHVYVHEDLHEIYFKC